MCQSSARGGAQRPEAAEDRHAALRLDDIAPRWDGGADAVYVNRANIGFIFQQFNLVDRLTLLQNVLVGMITRVPAWTAAGYRRQQTLRTPPSSVDSFRPRIPPHHRPLLGPLSEKNTTIAS